MKLIFKLLELYEKGSQSIGSTMMLMGMFLGNFRKAAESTWATINAQPEKYAYILEPFQEGCLLLIQAGSRFKVAFNHLKEVDKVHPDDFKELNMVVGQFKNYSHQIEECMKPYHDVIKNMDENIGTFSIPDFIKKSDEFSEYLAISASHTEPREFARMLINQMVIDGAKKEPGNKALPFRLLEERMPSLLGKLGAFGYLTLTLPEGKKVVFWDDPVTLTNAINEEIDVWSTSSEESKAAAVEKATTKDGQTVH